MYCTFMAKVPGEIRQGLEGMLEILTVVDCSLFEPL